VKALEHVHNEYFMVVYSNERVSGTFQALYYKCGRNCCDSGEMFLAPFSLLQNLHQSKTQRLSAHMSWSIAYFWLIEADFVK